MVKKIVKIFGIIIVLLLAAIILLPVIFKDDIIAKVKEEANNNLNAKVDFGEFDLGLLSSFPDFTFNIKEVKVSGVGQFEGLDLADIGELDLRIDLMSIINGGAIGIKSIQITDPNIHVVVSKEGLANYDIAKESEGGEVEEEESTDAEGEDAFQLNLNSFVISKGNIIYDDQEGNMFAEITNLNFDLAGDFTADFTSLITNTTIDALTYKMDGITYLNKVAVKAKADIDADLANSKYTFKENTVQVNNLEVGMDGWLALIGEEDMDMDLTFAAKKSEFKSVLSLIPAVYSKEFESVQTDGVFALSGYARGMMSGESYPAFDLNLLVENAMFKYPDLPKSVNDINIAVKVNSKGGDLDNTIVDVSKFHVEMAGNPFDISMLLKTPMSDPFIKAGFDGKLDLGSIKDVVPLDEGDALEGVITSNIHIEGNQSTIDNEQYENFKAEGSLLVNALVYSSKELPYDVRINTMDITFSPKFVNLNKMEMLVGKSDFSINGKLENFIPYALDDKAVLRGVLNVNSKKMDLTEFMEEEEVTAEGTEGSPAEEAPMEVAEIPANIDFEMNANFASIHMDSLDITNMVGQILIKDQKMTINNAGLNMLGGKMTTTGYYETTNLTSPSFDFNMAIDHFDVQQTMISFNSVEEMAPLFKGATGKYSTSLSIKGNLNEQMDPRYETLYGLGKLKTHDVVVKSFKALTKIAEQLKKDDLKQINMENVDISYEIKEGKVFMKPFDMKIGNIKTTVAGWNSFDQSLEYTMDMAIPRSEMGGATNKIAEQMFSSVTSKLGLEDQVKLPEIINMRAIITGTNDDPKVNLKLMGTEGGDTGQSAKDKLNDELNKKKKEAEERLKAEADKLKRDAEAKKAQAEAEARQKAEEAKRKAQEEANRKKREAEEKAKKEAEAAKKKAEEEAKKKLKGVFK